MNKLIQFSLKDVFWLTLVVALILGWCINSSYHTNTINNQEQVIQTQNGIIQSNSQRILSRDDKAIQSWKEYVDLRDKWDSDNNFKTSSLESEVIQLKTENQYLRGILKQKSSEIDTGTKDKEP